MVLKGEVEDWVTSHQSCMHECQCMCVCACACACMRVCELECLFLGTFVLVLIREIIEPKDVIRSIYHM